MLIREELLHFLPDLMLQPIPTNSNIFLSGKNKKSKSELVNQLKNIKSLPARMNQISALQ